MNIKYFYGKTEEEAINKAKKELGDDVSIINVKEKKAKGFFKSKEYEVTAGIEDDSLAKETAAGAQFLKSMQNSQFKSSNQPVTSTSNGSFDAVADDDFDLSVFKDTCKEVDQVLAKQENSTSALERLANTSNNATETNDTFEALGDTAPRAHIVTGGVTYSKPQNMSRQATNIISKSTEIKPSSAKVLEESVKREATNSSTKPIEETPVQKVANKDNQLFVKTCYNLLFRSDVQEKYINQVLGSVDKLMHSNCSVDSLLTNVYQKMILKLGTPRVIQPGEKRPKIVFFVGPTGVGKTTTIGKLASQFTTDKKWKVGLITTDTFRMAAATQLQTFASILQLPLGVVYSDEEILDTIKNQCIDYNGLDIIMVDTTGCSHKKIDQMKKTQKFIEAVKDSYECEVYLVLSATSKQKDLFSIVDAYSFVDFSMIFTKLDETSVLGNIYNTRLYSNASLSYVTNGQNVPNDIEILNAQKLVKQLLEGGN